MVSFKDSSGVIEEPALVLAPIPLKYSAGLTLDERSSVLLPKILVRMLMCEAKIVLHKHSLSLSFVCSNRQFSERPDF